MRPIHINKRKKINAAGIYQISCYTNDKIYIGSTINFTRRIFYKHVQELKKGIHSNPHLQHHFNKYGEDDLLFDIIEIVPTNFRTQTIEQFKEYLLEREQYYIDTLNPEFNICKEAGSCLGVKRSKEFILSRSKSICQYNLNGSFIKTYIGIKEAGRLTKINFSSISANLRNVNKTAGNFLWEYQGIPITNKLKKYNDLICKIDKPICQFDLTGKFLFKYKNMKDAENKTGIKKQIIYKCIGKGLKTAGGFIWSIEDYLTEDIINEVNSRKEINSRLAKEIWQFTKDGKFIAKFKSFTETNKKLGIDMSLIRNCIIGKNQTAGGFIFTQGTQLIKNLL